LLVGGMPTPLKNMKVSWDYDIPNIWKNEIHVPSQQPDWGFIKLRCPTIDDQNTAFTQQTTGNTLL